MASAIVGFHSSTEMDVDRLRTLNTLESAMSVVNGQNQDFGGDLDAQIAVSWLQLQLYRHESTMNDINLWFLSFLTNGGFA